MRARDIVTPGDQAEIAGAHQVCTDLAQGSGITAEANNMMGSPYNYSASSAGYFAGESVKVYCRSSISSPQADLKHPLKRK
jgi:hypothetical protein